MRPPGGRRPTASEFDALAPAGRSRDWVEGEAAVNHVAKRLQVNKAEEVVFNPAAHKQVSAFCSRNRGMCRGGARRFTGR